MTKTFSISVDCRFIFKSLPRIRTVPEDPFRCLARPCHYSVVADSPVHFPINFYLSNEFENVCSCDHVFEMILSISAMDVRFYFEELFEGLLFGIWEYS